MRISPVSSMIFWLLLPPSQPAPTPVVEKEEEKEKEEEEIKEPGTPHYAFGVRFICLLCS